MVDVPVNHYKLIDYYDVWGNKENGYCVNGVCTVEDDICITEDSSDREIIDYLIDVIGYLSPNAREAVELESSDGNMIEIQAISDGFPIGRLEKIW